MKKFILILMILSGNFVFINAQEVRKIEKSVNCTILGTEKKVD
jgi:hypothetical protein